MTQTLTEPMPATVAELTDAWAERSLKLYANSFADLPAPARHFAQALMPKE